MNKIKFFTITIASALTVIGNSAVVYAAPARMADGNIFDAEYYAENNPDVASVLGTDANLLYSHYLNTGINEGRLPYNGATMPFIKRSNVSEGLIQARKQVIKDLVVRHTWIKITDPAILFDADYYASLYPEVVAVVGTDYKSLYDHYVNTGIYEGRSARLGYFPERGEVKLHPAYSQERFLQQIGFFNNNLKCIDFLQSKVNDSMSEREIVTVIHDEICNRMSYGECSTAVTPQTDMDAFLDGKCSGVCSQYCGVFSYMCGMVGIESHMVGSISMNHGWNRVRIDGIWYDIDVTWDDCLSNKDYFLTPAGTGIFADRPVNFIDRWFRIDMYPNLSFEDALAYINRLNSTVLH